MRNVGGKREVSRRPCVVPSHGRGDRAAPGRGRSRSRPARLRRWARDIRDRRARRDCHGGGRHLPERRGRAVASRSQATMPSRAGGGPMPSDPKRRTVRGSCEDGGCDVRGGRRAGIGRAAQGVLDRSRPRCWRVPEPGALGHSSRGIEQPVDDHSPMWWKPRRGEVEAGPGAAASRVGAAIGDDEDRREHREDEKKAGDGRCRNGCRSCRGPCGNGRADIERECREAFRCAVIDPRMPERTQGRRGESRRLHNGRDGRLGHVRWRTASGHLRDVAVVGHVQCSPRAIHSHGQER